MTCPGSHIEKVADLGSRSGLIRKRGGQGGWWARGVLPRRPKGSGVPWKGQEGNVLSHCLLPYFVRLWVTETGGWGVLKDPGLAGAFPLPPGPLPMEAIEKMASLCMRDPDEEEEGTDEEDVEADDDLLVRTRGGQGTSPTLSSRHLRLALHCVSLQAELNEVLGEEQKALETHPPVAQVYSNVTGPCSPWFKALLSLSAMGPRAGGRAPLSCSGQWDGDDDDDGVRGATCLIYNRYSTKEAVRVGPSRVTTQTICPAPPTAKGHNPQPRGRGHLAGEAGPLPESS